MNSKTSSSKGFFSKALIKADLRNNWPFPVAMTVILFLNFLAVADFGFNVTYDYETLYRRFVNDFSFSFFVSCIYSLFMGTKLFFYLDKVNSVSCMHGFPFSRRTLYASRLLSGGILIALPPTVITVIMLLVGAPYKSTVFKAEFCLCYLAMFLIYAAISFAISVFAMTVCGNAVVSVLFSLTIAILPAALLAFYEGVCGISVYGYVSNQTIVDILNFLYVFPTDLFPWRFLVYLCGAAIFITAGFFVYKVRPLENCEEVVAFKKLRAMFVFAVGLVLGMISYLFFCGMFSVESLMFMLPLGIVGIIGATMIARKQVSLRGTGGYLAIYISVILAFSLGIRFDLFGYERRIPASNSIEYIEITDGGRSYYNEYNFKYDELPDRGYSTPEEIEAIRALHAAYISEKDIDEADIDTIWHNNRYYGNSYTEITYHLKNGSKLERRYTRLSEENFNKYKLPVFDLQKARENRYPILDETAKEIISATVYDDRISTPAIHYSGADADILYNALCHDLRTIPYKDASAYGTLSVGISYYVPGTVISNNHRPSTYAEKENYSESIHININSNFTRTLAALEQIGYELTNEESFSQIQKLYIVDEQLRDIIEKSDYIYSYDVELTEVYPETKPYMGKYTDNDYDIEVTDSADIRAFYELCGVGFEAGLSSDEAENSKNYTFEFVNEKGEIVCSGSFAVIPQNLPAGLQKYFVK